MPIAVEKYLSSILPIAIQRGAPWGFEEARVRGACGEIMGPSDAVADVWEAGAGLSLVHLDTAEILDVGSTSATDDAAGTGARRIQIDGLDAAYAPISETVMLAGTTPVLTTQAFLRVNGVKVLTAGSDGNVNGYVSILSNDTMRLQAVMTSLSGCRSQQTQWTVPAGRVAYVMMARFSADIAETRFDLQAREPGGCFVSLLQYETGQTPAEPPFVVPQAIPEKSDIRVVARRLQGPSASVYASYDLITAPKSLVAIRSFAKP